MKGGWCNALWARVNLRVFAEFLAVNVDPEFSPGCVVLIVNFIFEVFARFKVLAVGIIKILDGVGGDSVFNLFNR